MNWMKRTGLAIVAGAAMSLTALASANAAPVPQSAAMTANAVAGSDTNLLEVRHGGRHFRGGRHDYRGGRHGYRGGRHGYRHGWRHRRRHNNAGFLLPLLAAPFIYEGLHERRYYRNGYDGNRYYGRRHHRDW